MYYLTYFILLLCGRMTLSGVLNNDMLGTWEDEISKSESLKNCQNFPISNLSLLHEQCSGVKLPNLAKFRFNETPHMCFSVIHNMKSLCSSSALRTTTNFTLDQISDLVPCDSAGKVEMNCNKDNDANCAAVKEVVTHVLGSTGKCQKYCVDEEVSSNLCKFLVATLEALGGEASEQAVPVDVEGGEENETGADESSDEGGAGDKPKVPEIKDEAEEEVNVDGNKNGTEDDTKSPVKSTEEETATNQPDVPLKGSVDAKDDKEVISQEVTESETLEKNMANDANKAIGDATHDKESGNPAKQVDNKDKPEAEVKPAAGKGDGTGGGVVDGSQGVDGKNDDVSGGKAGQPKETIKAENTFVPGEHFDDDQSSFFTYFVLLSIVAILAYLVFHNKQKILALILEGRRRQSSRRTVGGRQYRKLDSNLEDTMTSNRDTGSQHVVY